MLFRSSQAKLAARKAMHEAREAFQKAQEEVGDNRRFGRWENLQKATIEQLRAAAADNRVSPETRYKIERKLRGMGG